MKLITKIEKTYLKLFTYVPHLPRPMRSWVADNGWRIALLVGIACTAGAFALIPTTMASLAIAAKFDLAPYAIYYDTAASMSWAILLVDTISFVITALLLGFAIAPLKAKKRQGWRLGLGVYLFNVAIVLASFVIMLQSMNLFFIIPLLIGGYLIRETHEFFHAK